MDIFGKLWEDAFGAPLITTIGEVSVGDSITAHIGGSFLDGTVVMLADNDGHPVVDFLVDGGAMTWCYLDQIIEHRKAS